MENESITRNIAERLENIPETDDFDRLKDFDEKIGPVLHDLKCLCNQYRIPFFFTACVGNKKDKSTYKSTMISPMEFPTRLRLYDDKISKCLGIMIGFDSVYPKKDLEIDVEAEISEKKDEFLQKLERELFVEKTYFERPAEEVGETLEEEKPVTTAPQSTETRKRGRPQKNDEHTLHIRSTALEFISSGRATNIKDMLKISKFNEKELKAVLVKLKKEGIIKRMGAKKNGYWVIAEIPVSQTE